MKIKQGTLIYPTYETDGGDWKTVENIGTDWETWVVGEKALVPADCACGWRNPMRGLKDGSAEAEAAAHRCK